MAASVSRTEELTDKPVTRCVRRVAVSCVCVWSVVIVLLYKLPLLPRIVSLSQSANLVQ